MLKYKTEIAHDLGQKKAVERIKENTEWACGISDLQGTWVENTFAFSVSIQGISLKGHIQVEEDSLELDIHLPLIAMPFKGWLPNIREKITRLVYAPGNRRHFAAGASAARTAGFLHLVYGLERRGKINDRRRFDHQTARTRTANNRA
jgi:hypothetical protein